jgi:hypothetical protein
LEKATVAEQIAEQLAPYLGPFNASNAVRTWSLKKLDMPPESLRAEHLPTLLEALRPMLCTFLGRGSAAALVEKIGREVRG